MFRLTLCYCCLSLLVSALAAADEPGKAHVPEVTVCHPVVREVTDCADFTGHAEAATSVTLRPRVTGYLEEISFKGGEKVEKGQVLFRIDSRRQQAACDERMAEIRVAEANLKLAQTSVERDKRLVATGTVSSEQLNQDQAAANSAEAAMLVARTRLDAARLELEFTRVVAPISGRIGMPALSVGNLVTADSTALATIDSTDPIYVFVDIDERTALTLGRGATAGQPLACALADEDHFPRKAQIDAVDNHLDASTGTLRLRGMVANSDGRILPGMSIRARLKLGQPYKALLVPTSAIVHMKVDNQLLTCVSIVDAENVERRRTVKLGAFRGEDFCAVKEGLAQEDRVIFETPLIHSGEKVEPTLREIKTPHE